MGRDRRRTLCGGISGKGRLQETTGPGVPGPYRATADGQSVGRGAPTPPRACGHMPFPVRLRRGAASPTPCGGCPANDACGKCPGGTYAAPTNRRVICGIQRQTRRGQDPSLQASKSLPPWGKVAPQGRMRGKLPGSSRLPITCGPGVPGPYEPAGASPLTETKNQKSTRMARAMRVFTFYVNISQTY